MVDELVKLAHACDGAKAVKDARAELDVALVVLPDSKKAKDEIEKLAKKDDKPAASWSAKFEKDRKKTHEKCAGALADQALSWQKAKDDARAAKLGQLIHDAFPECDKQLEKAGYKWFEPYLELHPLSEAKLLDAGGEQIDGKWTEAAAVAELDKKHASWTDPWVISDDVHEVRTTLPLRTAKRVLLNVGLYRKFFLGRFQGSWDLKPPASKLPVIVTATQADQTARIDEEATKRGVKLNGAPQGAAIYLEMLPGELSPCFVTFEPADGKGKPFKVEFDHILFPLKREITHQICFELSKHDYDKTRGIKNQFWVVAAIANYMPYYAFDHGHWRLTKPAKVALAPGASMDGAFAYTKNHLTEVPEIKDLIAIPREKMTLENCHLAGTLAYFLLEGENGKYRDGFIKLCETVHKIHDAPDSFGTCFKGVDLAAMQREFRTFVNKIQIDP